MATHTADLIAAQDRLLSWVMRQNRSCSWSSYRWDMSWQLTQTRPCTLPSSPSAFSIFYFIFCTCFRPRSFWCFHFFFHLLLPPSVHPAPHLIYLSHPLTSPSLDYLSLNVPSLHTFHSNLTAWLSLWPLLIASPLHINLKPPLAPVLSLSIPPLPAPASLKSHM